MLIDCLNGDHWSFKSWLDVLWKDTTYYLSITKKKQQKKICAHFMSKVKKKSLFV